MHSLTESELDFIVSRILSNANKAFQENDNSDFENGRRLAYYEMLDTIKNELILRDVDISKYGLNINLEELL